MTASSENIRYDVWIRNLLPDGLGLLESMNAPDAALRLPVQPLPAVISGDGHRFRFSGEAPESRIMDVVGPDVGTDPFRPDHVLWHRFDKWTAEKFDGFVRSRRHLHLAREDDGPVAPTLTALAAYLLQAILVSYRRGETRHLIFITPWGEVTAAEYTGGEEGLTDIRDTFFTRNRDTALRLPGLRILPAPPEPHRTEAIAMMRREQVSDWKQAHHRGRLKGPAGAELGYGDLRVIDRDDMDMRRTVIASARSSKHLYELIVPPFGELAPLEVTCAVDCVVRDYVDPATGQNKGRGAWVSDWADWILNHSAPDTGAPASGVPWEGSGTGVDMYRLEHNIVAYAEHESDLARFGSTAELQAWLRRSLGNHNADLGVFLLDDLPLVLEGSLPMFQHAVFNRSGDPEPKIGYLPRQFDPWSGLANWLDNDGGYSRHPVLSTVMDGRTLESFSAFNCLDDGWLNNHYVREEHAPAAESTWFIVRLEGTGTAMAFPAVGTVLSVTTDLDGAAAMITAREAGGRRREIDRETGFEKQWDRWLNDDRPLAKDEIQAGLAAVNRLIEEARA